MSARSLPLAAALLLALPTGSALADGLTVPEPETQIYGGTETEQCAWPTVAYLSSDGAACTGALIHPEIVLTAAHCVPGDVTATVRFGERASTASQLAETEYCRANPSFFGTGDGDDYGFCKLATPITNIPIIPIAYGCEETILGPGTQITHVGFGVDENGDSGRKKFVTLNVQSEGGGEIITGSNGEGICSGDSGGPVFVKLNESQGGDDTWRVVGIHSWAQMAEPGECNGVAGSTIAWNAVDFIESESGIDVTPCHASNGTWEPTWGCQGFPQDPGIGGDGSYALMCETGPLGDFSEVCGAPLTDFPDTDAPSLDVVSPEGDQVFEVDGSDSADLHIEANADDGDGWGIAGVELIIAPEDGEMVSQSLDYAPFRWNTKFPVGGYNLKLVATDNAGNVTESDWIAVGVGAAPPDNPPGEDDTGEGDGGDTGDADETGGDDGDDGDDDDDDDDDDDGDSDDGAPQADAGGGGSSGCSIGDRGGWMPAALALGLLVRRRRTIAPRR